MKAIIVLAFLGAACTAAEPELQPVQLPEPAIPYDESVKLVDFSEDVPLNYMLRVMDFADAPIPDAFETVNVVDSADVPISGGFQEIAPSELESINIFSPPEEAGDAVPPPYYPPFRYQDPTWR